MEKQSGDMGYQLLMGKRAVYGRDDSIEVHIEGSEEPAKDFMSVRSLILPARYTEPNEDDVVDYLRQRAAKLTGLKLPAGFKLEGENKIDQLLRKLPDKLQDSIKNGNPNWIRFIRAETPAPQKEEGRPNPKYLFVRYGILPVDIIENNQEKGNIESAEWYSAAFADYKLQRTGFGPKLTIKLLLEGDVLPQREDIDFLLKHRTHGSQTMEIDRECYDVEMASEVIDFVYAEFHTSQEIVEVEDISGKVLEQHAIIPIMAIHKSLTESAFQAGLERGMGKGRHS